MRWRDAAAVADPWGARIDWQRATPEQLVERLGDQRHAVRDRAQKALAARGRAAVGVSCSSLLGGRAGVDAKRQAVWTLSAVADDAALPPLRRALQSGDPELAVPAARALGLRRDREAVPELARLLSADSPPIQLAAAEALARCADIRALAALWEALRDQPDRFLEHALVYTVHRTADGAALTAALREPNPRVQKAALLLLDQPPRMPGLLAHQVVISRIAAADPELRQTALSILARHPEWSEQAVGLLRAWLRKNQLTADERTSLPALLLAFQGSSRVQDLIAESLASTSAIPPERRVLVLETLARVSLTELPPNWAAALRDCVGAPEPAVRRQAVHSAAVLQLPQLDDALIGLAARWDEPALLRLEALRAVILRRPRLSAPLFGLLLARLDRREGPLDRLSAAEILGRSHLDDAQLAQLLLTVRGDTLVSPAVLLPAMQRSVTRKTAKAMLDYLAEAAGGREAVLAAGRAEPDKTLAAGSPRGTARLRERSEICGATGRLAARGRGSSSSSRY